MDGEVRYLIACGHWGLDKEMARTRRVGSIHNGWTPSGNFGNVFNNYHTSSVDLSILMLNGLVLHSSSTHPDRSTSRIVYE